MAAPIAAKTPPPNNNPLNVTPVAMIASKATNSIFSVFIRLLCLLVTIHAAKVCNYFICTNNLDYFFSSISVSGAKRPFSVFLCVPLCSSVFLLLPYLQTNISFSIKSLNKRINRMNCLVCKNNYIPLWHESSSESNQIAELNHLIELSKQIR